MTDRGKHLFPVVLAGPSGGGKTTVRTALLQRMEHLQFSVSATTRLPREGETDGRDYRFVGRSAFEGLIERGDLLEWAEVHGELYGTPRENLQQARAAGAHLLLDIDVQGARQLRETQPDAVSIFILPPDFGRLVERLQLRGSEDETMLRRRLRTALSELDEVHRFDYAVVNDDLEETVRLVESIIATERHRVDRLSPEARGLIGRLGESLTRMLEASVEEKARRQ